VVLTLVAFYGAYALATIQGASGLIAVAMTGLFYGNSIMLHLGSTRVAQATSDFWKIMAFIANAVAFFFIGVSTNFYLLATGFGAILVAYGIVMMARITLASRGPGGDPGIWGGHAEHTSPGTFALTICPREVRPAADTSRIGRS
jgi:hypothetical protein